MLSLNTNQNLAAVAASFALSIVLFATAIVPASPALMA